MIEVKLAGHFDTAPMWWQNFVNAQIVRSKEMDNETNILQLIFQELAEHGITRTPVNGYIILTFNDAMKYTWFILRWS